MSVAITGLAGTVAVSFTGLGTAKIRAAHVGMLQAQRTAFLSRNSVTTLASYPSDFLIAESGAPFK